MSSDTVWLFPGQGVSCQDAYLSLFHENATYRDACLTISNAFNQRLGIDILGYIYPGSEGTPALLSASNTTLISQAAIFTVEYALLACLKASNISPAYLIGHSFGEYVAAYVSGIFDIDTLITVIIKRGELIDATLSGSMLSVSSNLADLKQIITSSCIYDIACINSPKHTVLSGAKNELEKIQVLLSRSNIHSQFLPVNRAFHSASLDPILDSYFTFLNQCSLLPPSIPIISNLTGKILTQQQACDPQYWVDHLRQTVQFMPCIQAITTRCTSPTFIEVGPGKILTHFVRKMATQKNITFRRISDTTGKLITVFTKKQPVWSPSNVKRINTSVKQSTAYKLLIAIIERYDAELIPSGVDIKLGEIDSLCLLSIVKEINDYYHASLKISDLMNIDTLGELCEYAAAHDTGEVISRVFPSCVSNVTVPQKSILFLQSKITLKSVYNVFRVYKITGPLDITRLEASLQRIMMRHSILRSGFSKDFSSTHLMLRLDDSIKYIDLTSKNVDIYPLLQNAANYQFDIHNESAARFVVYKTTESTHYLVLLFHHSVIDGWSVNLIIRELSDCYNDNDANESLSLPFDYYAYTQNQYMASQRYKQDCDFWKHYLNGSPKVTSVKFDDGKASDYTGDTIYVSLTGNLYNKLNMFKKNEKGRITTFNILMACLYLLIYQFNNRRDNIIGAIFSGRNDKQFDDTVGYFVNPIPLRIQHKSGDSFVDLLRSISKNFLSCLSYSSVPFEKIVNISGHTNDLYRNPLFQILINYQKNAQPLQFDKVCCDEYILSNHTSKFELTLWIWEYDDHIRLGFEYASNVLSVGEVQNIIHHYLEILDYYLLNPLSNVNEVISIGQNRIEESYNQFNATKQNYLNKVSIATLFSEVVHKYGQSVAIVDDDKELTFQSLDTHSNLIASHLLKQGVHYQQFVGVYLSRSWKMITALLAIIKIGAVFVPLDPQYPKKRLTYMIEQSGLSVILTAENGHNTPLVNLDQINLIDIDTILEQSSLLDSIEPMEAINQVPEILYLMYTSGSTGKPKGVLGTTVGFLNRAYWMWKTYPYQLDEVACQKTSLNFVDSIWEIFGPLLAGIKLVIINDDDMRSMHSIRRIMNQYGVTRITLVPTLLQLFLDQPVSIKSLKLCICSGEILLSPLVNQFKKSYPAATLLNLYGSTEVAGDITYFDVSDYRKTDDQHIPIGYPINNTSVYVLSHHMKLAPIGSLGHIYVGGDGLAKGYWNNEAQTTQAFIKNPFGSGYLYNMGDMGYLNEDRQLCYLGRIDQQIKVRGVRIETQEIIVALLKQPAIKKAHVLVDKDNNNILLAYVVLTNPPCGKIYPYIDKAILNNLRSDIPTTMLPTAVVVIEEFPTLPNGKLDNKRFPTLATCQTHLTRTITTHTQDKLANIYKDILDVHPRSIDADFFNLGGHSLLIMQLLNEIERIFSIPLSIDTIFENPTIGEQAALIDSAITKGTQSKKNNLLSCNDVNMSLSKNQQYILLPEILHTNRLINVVSFYIRICDPIDEAVLEKSINKLMDIHTILKTHLVKNDNHDYIHEIKDYYVLKLKIVDLKDDDKETTNPDDVISYMHNLSSQPFDLHKTPLFRMILLKLQKGNILLVNIHHLISDGWSLRLLCKDLDTIYCGYLRGDNINIKRKQYFDYITHQSSYLQSAVFEKSMRYWKQNISDFTNFSSGNCPHTSDTTEIIYVNLDINQSNLLYACKQSCPQPITIFSILLSINYLTIQHIFSSDDIIVITPMAGRTDAIFNNTIGCFMNPVLLRKKIQPDESFSQFVISVQKMVSDAYHHQAVPFNYQTSFLKKNQVLPFSVIMQNFQENLSFHDKQVRINPLLNHRARNDITVWIWEDNGKIRLGFEYIKDTINRSIMDNYINFFTTLIKKDRLDQFVTRTDEEENPAKVESLYYRQQKRLNQKFETPGFDSKLYDNKLTTILKSVLNINTVKRNDDFFDIGDSLAAMNLLLQIENEYNRAITYQDLINHSTFGELQQFLNAKMMSSVKTKTTLDGVIQLNQSDNAQHVFMVHPVLGLSTEYRILANALQDYQCIGINDPYFYNLTSYDSLRDMASDYLHKVTALQKKSPYILIGWSFGGVVAYEIASQLYQQGINNVAVVMLDSFNLSTFKHQKSWTKKTILDYLSHIGINQTDPNFEYFVNEISRNNQLLRDYVPDCPLFNVFLLKAANHSAFFSSLQDNPTNGWHFDSTNFKTTVVNSTHEGIVHHHHTITLCKKLIADIGYDAPCLS